MYYKQGLLEKLERKYRKFSIQNLMMIVVGAMGIVFIMDLFISSATGQSISAILMFDRNAIMSGQVWRIFTFLFIPPDSSIIFIIFSLYFYWLIGSTLENQWGSFGFTLYYLLGAIGAIISGMISGYATNSYLNLSLFFAFALLNPDFQILLFFIIPIKMKYIAAFNAVSFVIMFIYSGWSGRISIVAALINLFIFFTPHFIDYVKTIYRRIRWKNKFK